MNKYHVVLQGNCKKDGMNFVLHRNSLEEAKEEASKRANDYAYSVISVTFCGVTK
jgi:hypothetical protein